MVPTAHSACLTTALILMGGCAGPASAPTGPAPDGSGPTEVVWQRAPLSDLPPGLADDLAPETSDADCEGGGDGAWDPTPPTSVDGSVLTASLTCGLFDGSGLKSWVMDGGVWLEQPGGSVSMHPEVQPCLEPGPKELVWTPDGDIEFDSASWQHAFKPTASPWLWLGQGRPYHDLDDACLDGLESLGLTLPIVMSLEVLAVTPP